MSLMGLENQGKKEVQKEVSKKLTEVKGNIDKKLNGGDNGFDKTFNSILNFNPKSYIDEVIKDFGKHVCKLQTNGNSKNRSFECIAKAVSKCMNKAVEQIKTLAEQNKTTMEKYSVSDIGELNGFNITPLNDLTTIDKLKQLCQGFKSFHTAYKKVLEPLKEHLSTAQQNGTWSKITKCVEAFKELGECVEDLQELESMSGAENMTTASGKLGKISEKLQGVHDKLKDESLKGFSAQVDKFIDKLDEDELKKKGVEALATALKPKSGTQQPFSDFLKSYVSTLITKMKENNTNNTVYDLHLRVRNDLLQLSECLKVMCEVCSTGMHQFADKLKECVDKGKENLDKLYTVQRSLERLRKYLYHLVHDKERKDIDNAMEWSLRPLKFLLEREHIFNPPIIVNTLIDNTAVQKMTTYLKSLPDLIRDRYVLQKWKDDAKAFCGVQEFKDGIVKKTDTDGIKKKLQELLRDTYHNAAEVTIHDFQVKSLIYNFCHKEGIKGIGEGIKVMNDVTKKMNDIVEWTNINSKKRQLLSHLICLSTSPYLKHFARHLRDSTSYYYLCNSWTTQPLSPNLANAETIDNYIRATN